MTYGVALALLLSCSGSPVLTDNIKPGWRSHTGLHEGGREELSSQEEVGGPECKKGSNLERI